jgi:hypothetical protein
MGMGLRELSDVVAELALKKADGVLPANGNQGEMREIEQTTGADLGCIRSGIGLGEAGDPLLVESSGTLGQNVSPQWVHVGYLKLKSAGAAGSCVCERPVPVS